MHIHKTIIRFFAGFVCTGTGAAHFYVKVEVDGLSCPFCAYGLEKFMYRLEGAKDVYISVQGNYTTFAVPVNDKPSEEEINKVVDKAGFTPGKITYSGKPFSRFMDDFT